MNTDEQLAGKVIALLASNGYEDSELTEPKEAVEAAGATVVVISDTDEDIIGKHGTETIVNELVKEADASKYDGLLLPGGVKNPDHLRMNEHAIRFVRSFFDQGKPVAAICHAPWLLIEADVVRDRELTSWPSLRTDLINAGAQWVDEEVVVDSGLVTSRNPDDIPAFCAKAIEEFAEGVHPQ